MKKHADLYPLRQIEPALARGVFRPDLMSSPDWVAEVKYDGDRRLAQFCDRVRFTGRRRSVTDGLFVEKTRNVPHLALGTIPSGKTLVDSKALMRGMMSLQGTILDGEMIPFDPPQPGSVEGRSKFVTSVMGSHPSVAIEKQHASGFLRFVVFDVLFWRGEDVRSLSFKSRRHWVEEAVRVWGHPFVSTAKQRPLLTDTRIWLDELWSQGEEGIILKRLAAPYGDKQAWVKVKNVMHIDGVLMGFEEAKATSLKVSGEESSTKFYDRGWIGALKIGQYQGSKLVEVATVSGMTEELREEISRRRTRYLGRVVEIKANGREPTGRFRHPQFVRFREDKRPEECRCISNES